MQRLRRFFSLACLVTVVLVLDCAVLLQQAEAQTISVRDASAREGDNIVFTVELSARLNRTAELTAHTRDGTAGANDFVQVDSSGGLVVRIPAGRLRTTFFIPGIQDDLAEGDETFEVILTPTVTGLTIARNTATGTILDDDDGVLSINGFQAHEGADLVFTVSLDAPLPFTLTVPYAVDGTAKGTLDYTLPPPAQRMFTIPRGQMTASIRFPTIFDDSDENRETVELTLGTPSGGNVVFGQRSATGTIIDHPSTVSVGNATAAEGGTLVFEVRRSSPVFSPATVNWEARSGTATLIDDLADGVRTTGTATFDIDETTTTIELLTRLDDRAEGDENLTVTLSNARLPTGAGLRITEAVATGTITDDDPIVLKALPSPGYNSTGEHLAIGNAGFELISGNTGNEPLIVNIVPRADNTLTEGQDYRLFSKQIIVPAHTSRFRGFSGIQIIDDSVTENFREAFRFDLDVVSSHDVVIENTAFFTITDNDFVRIRLSDSAASASAVEGDTIVFTAELDYYRTRSAFERLDGGGISVLIGPGSVAKPFELLWTATGTGFGDSATVADDLAMQSGTVTVPALSQTATISIPIVNDAEFEEDETFTLTLTGTDGLDPADRSGIRADRVTVYPDQSATGTILSNDESLVAYFPPGTSSSSTAIAEGDQGLASDEWQVLRVPLLSPRAGAFTWSTVGGTAAADQDFVAVSNRPADLAFEMPLVKGEFQIRGDTIVEADETFTIEFTPATSDFPFMLLPDGTRRDNLSVTITDDDNAVVSLQPTAAAGEGDGTITFTVALDNPVAEPFSLAWTATDGTATVAEDLGTQSGTVMVPALARTATFSIAVVDDEAVEPTETFTVSLSGDATGLVAIDPGKITINQSAREATGTITDNDGATVAISPSSLTAPEGGTFTFRVTLGEAVAQDVTVAWAAAGSGGNAATLADPGSDLVDGQDTTGTVTIQANTTTAQTITIATVNDTLMEGDETFTVTLTEPPATPLPDGVEFATSRATATITDDDDAIVSIAPAQATAEEGDPFSFTVSLSRAQSSPVTATWTAGATGTNPATLSGPDSDLAPGQGISDLVTFPANTTTAQTITIATGDDARVEADETFVVTLGPGAGGLPDGLSLGNAEATGTITNNDGATVTIGNASAAENAGPANFTVSPSQAASRDVVLGVAYTAVSADPAADLGDDRPATVTIPANTTSAILAVPLNDDMIVEGTETFTVTIAEAPGTPLPDGVSIPGGTAAGTGTITEDDTAIVVITQATTEAAEGATFAFMAGLSRQVDQAVTVRWTAAPGIPPPDDPFTPATVTGPESDFAAGQAATGTVTFAANGTTPRPFSIATRNDGRDEGDEVFMVTLSPNSGNSLPTGVSVPGGATEATITDRAGGNATLSIFPPAATQPEGDPFPFEVRLSRAATAPVTVTWTAAGSGDNAATVSGTGADLAAGQDTTGTLTFNTGDTTAKPVTIATVDDDRVEGAETFTVRLTGTLPAGVEYATDRATATITEDDTAELSIVEAATAAEGSPVEFAVSLGTASENPVTVRWTATTAGGDGAATLEGATSDLTASHDLTGTVVFTANDTADKTVSLATLNDTRVEGSETFTVTLSQDTQGGNLLPVGVSISTTEGAGTGTITEDDAATVSIETAATAAEGSPVEFAVNLSAASAQAVTVRWTATTAVPAAGAATLEGATSDLTANHALTGTVVFTANDTAAKTVSLATVDDDRVEGPETFTVTLSPDDDNPLPDGITIPAATEAGTGTITEDDAATLSIDDAEAAEGTPVAFEVSLSAASMVPVTVRWTATGRRRSRARGRTWRRARC